MNDKPTKDPLAELAKKVSEGRVERKISKASRTHKLAEPQYSVFYNYCKEKGFSQAGVIDELIAAFLDKVKDDLPIDWDVLNKRLD